MEKPAVMVTWEDAASYGGWQSNGVDEDAPMVNHSIGWLLRNDARVVVLAMSYNAWKYGDKLIIPKAVVKSVLSLEAVPC